MRMVGIVPFGALSPQTHWHRTLGLQHGSSAGWGARLSAGRVPDPVPESPGALSTRVLLLCAGVCPRPKGTFLTVMGVNVLGPSRQAPWKGPPCSCHRHSVGSSWPAPVRGEKSSLDTWSFVHM